jgi:[acyl-carrier-protein] S-malonyltransferase
MRKIGILFSGQGSQYTGMGQDFYESKDIHNFYEKASEILGYDLKAVIFEENPLLNNTLYTQPAILVTSLVIYEVLKQEYQLHPQAMAGFSLGEYSALCASGVFTYEQIVQLIDKRAKLMEEASLHNKGMMAAVIGMDQDVLLELCQSISTEDDFVTIANYNCPNQLVVSGTKEKVEELGQVAKARRFIPLNVSGGFHTSLMDQASNGIYEMVQSSSFNHPTCDVYMNASAKPLEIKELPELMKNQINSPVLFEQSIRNMLEAGIDCFIEIGPGKVLSGFVKKIDRSIPVVSIDTLEDLIKLKESGVLDGTQE